MKKDNQMDVSGFYIMSMFQDCESYLRTKIDLIEDGIRLVLEEYNSDFIIDELEPGIYTFKDLSEAVFGILQPEYELFNISIDIEVDDINKKNKLVCKTRYYSYKL